MAVDLVDDVVHCLADLARWAEGLAALLNADSAQVSGPLVDILEEVPVDALRVREIV